LFNFSSSNANSYKFIKAEKQGGEMKVHYNDAFPTDAYYETCLLEIKATCFEDCKIIRNWHRQIMEHLNKLRIGAKNGRR